MDPSQLVEETLVVTIVVAVAAAVAIGFVTWLLLRAADKPSGSMVTLSLTLLTIFAIGVYAATREEVMAAIVGTGLGALAGAVTYQLGGGQERLPPSQQQGQNEPDITSEEP